ncbi:TetR/AcrR family transcriptional regulator [Verrucomicrobiales bacterium BCK34]|nr:TetR/AcrR family transcriptional regulator [Verrucomicrobiales bacterium BCK34]
MASDPEKQNQILTAALEVFLRYGFKKATMGDIADKAGMSRPSVYLVFPNKEDIFRGVISRKVEEFSRDTKEKLGRCTGVRDGIFAVLETWVVEPFELVSTSPESEELLEFGCSFDPDLRKQMLETTEQQLLQAIRSGLETESGSGEGSGLSDQTLARLITVSTAEMKQCVTSPAELRKLIEATVEVYVSYLSGRDA